MRVKVSEITSLQLDWIVTDLEGVKTYGIKDWLEQRPHTTGQRWSKHWAQGGPIIERERFEFRQARTGMLASYQGGPTWFGQTHLIAAMRCYVASKLGDEVEIPEELK